MRASFMLKESPCIHVHNVAQEDPLIECDPSVSDIFQVGINLKEDSSKFLLKWLTNDMLL